MPKEKKEYKKIWLVLITLGVIVFTVILVVYAVNKKKDYGIKGLEKANSLEEYLLKDPSLNQVKELGLTNKKVDVPFTPKLDNVEITLVPELMGGGDIIYRTVVKTDRNKYFVLNEDNQNKVFDINSNDEAKKYIDFVMTKIGKTSYDRIRKTVWEEKDYEKIKCNDSDVNYYGGDSIPSKKPITKAVSIQGGYEVTWIYYTPTYPAGYWKEVYTVTKDGNINKKEKSSKPFWSCGGGIMF